MDIDFSVYNKQNLLPEVEEYELKTTHLDDSMEAVSKAQNLLETARHYWYALSDFREERKRARDYYLGYQWLDTISDPDNSGETITEEEYIIRQGKQPMVNNQISPLIKNLRGQFRENDYKPVVRSRKKEDAQVTEMMTNALQSVYDVARLVTLDVNQFLEFLLSGAFMYRSSYDYFKERNENNANSHKVNPTRMIINTDVQDPRLNDLRFVGEIHDLHIGEIIRKFAKDDEDADIIRKWYQQSREQPSGYEEQIGAWREDSLDFYYPVDSNQCRVIEIWEERNMERVFGFDPLEAEVIQYPMEVDEALAMIEAENEVRKLQGKMQGIPEENIPLIESEIRDEDVCWYYFLTPWGNVLESGETPYEHESHPYTLGLYPMIDSEIRSFVQDIIDHQKQINRLLTLMDFVISSSAKGVWIIPESAYPKGWSLDDVTNELTRANGVVAVTDKAFKEGTLPKQVQSQAQNVGAQQLYAVILQQMKEVSGINEAIQGQKLTGVNTASQYAQMTANSTLSTKDYFEYFVTIRRERDQKLLQIIQQHYDEERYVNVSGQDYSESNLYKPELAKDVPLEVVVTKSANSPVYRDQIEQTLLTFMQMGVIDPTMYLENSSLPFSKNLLQQMQEKQEALQGGQQQEINPEAEKLVKQLINNKVN